MPNLNDNPIHLGLGASAVIEPTFTGEMDWYEGYGQRHGAEATAVFITAGMVTEHRAR